MDAFRLSQLSIAPERLSIIASLGLHRFGSRVGVGQHIQGVVMEYEDGTCDDGALMKKRFKTREMRCVHRIC